MEKADICIIGAGIVGLSTALQIHKKYPNKQLIILDKESIPAFHQTGHNSGVLHSGIYYKPGSLKAINCREGKKAMEAFCKEEGIPFELCGKVIVATRPDELERLHNIYQRGQKNGVKCEIINKSRLLELEPHCAGLQAIHVPEAGIINYKEVCKRIAHIITDNTDNLLILNSKVLSITEDGHLYRVITNSNEYQAKHVINCSGLQSDRITKAGGTKPEVMIFPFRGEYYELRKSAEHLCNTLIYPVPDPRYPFLGVHFTKLIEGGVECGPNAVFATAREGYSKYNFNLRDVLECITYPGFPKLLKQVWQEGAYELWRSFSKGAFVRALQRLIPDIQSDHIIEAPSGVRAQAVSKDGFLLDDFLFQNNKRIINVCNAPSPAATSSLNIGKHILTRLEQNL
jgi:L-2-hydroxyglutarate oxidase